MDGDDDTSADDLAAALTEYERAAEKAWQAQTEPARAVIAAVRELLEATGASSDLSTSEGVGTSGPAPSTLATLMQDPTPMSLYQAVAMLAACIRGWSLTTGRSESEILDELANNYER